MTVLRERTEGPLGNKLTESGKTVRQALAAVEREVPEVLCRSQGLPRYLNDGKQVSDLLEIMAFI